MMQLRLYNLRPMARLKNTLLFLAVLCLACGNSPHARTPQADPPPGGIRVGAERFDQYAGLLKGKRVGIVTNQTGTVTYDSIFHPPDNDQARHQEAYKRKTVHIVDFLLENKVNLTAIYAPEHGFRGTADAGETIKDGRDTKTGLPIISLYGNNKKPSPQQLAAVDVMLFDLQDVGARFYTYISTLHYVMEACAESDIPLIILDRPNPNNGIIDGPVLDVAHKSFVGMHPIPVLHGMTIGEYGKMILGEKWAKTTGLDLTVIPCADYSRDMAYKLPVKPSPNLPNDRAVNLYASLCFFEGTNVSIGRGTDKQFQVYGSPFLPDEGYSFTPQPNEGAKNPPHNGKRCHGRDLSAHPRLEKLEIKWLMEAYSKTADKKSFFNNFFVKLAGTDELRKQIESGKSEAEIRKSWQSGLDAFKAIRSKYLLYPN